MKKKQSEAEMKAIYKAMSLGNKDVMKAIKDSKKKKTDGKKK